MSNAGCFRLVKLHGGRHGSMLVYIRMLGNLEMWG